jgi:hypothetical protein
VITDPIGLAGFALFLVFRLVAKKGKKPQWLASGAYVMAFLALAGGITLAYFRIRATASQTPPSSTSPSQPPAASTANQQNIGEIKQQSSGNAAVNAAGVQGPVTVNSGSASPTATPLPRK